MTADFPDWGPAVRAGRFRLQGSGTAIIAVTGTAVALRAATICQQVMLRARKLNVGTLYLGAVDVNADESAAAGGLQLAAGDLVSFPVDDLHSVWLNGTAGDGVSFIYWL